MSGPEDNPSDSDPHGECKLEIQRLNELLAAHRRFHDKAICPGRPECYVCAEEEWFETHEHSRPCQDCGGTGGCDCETCNGTGIVHREACLLCAKLTCQRCKKSLTRC